MKCTRAEYLKARGWLGPAKSRDGFAEDAPLIDVWCDPSNLDNDGIDTEDAVTLQLARDAVDERTMYREAFNARFSIGHRVDAVNGSTTTAAFTVDQTEGWALAAVERYRRNFAPEFTD